MYEDGLILPATRTLLDDLVIDQLDQLDRLDLDAVAAAPNTTYPNCLTQDRG